MFRSALLSLSGLETLNKFPSSKSAVLLKQKFLQCCQIKSINFDSRSQIDIGEDDHRQSSTLPVVSQSDVSHPIIKTIQLGRLSSTEPLRQVWIENMSTPDSIKLGLMELQPEIFSAFPRPDLISENHKWQTLYKHVNWLSLKTRSELKGSNRKPWPQKGTGRARHSSRRAPQWKNGGWACGPRGPKTYFYMLPHAKRVQGLIATLSAKFSQNDVHIVDTFRTFPEDGTVAHLEELCENRNWGPSVLFVDQIDLQLYPKKTFADHFAKVVDEINHINLLPVYGLNVFSMIKHETLVMTVDALETIQRELLFQLNRIDLRNANRKYKPVGLSNLGIH
ncbi:39S ribosomal protein L4 [Sarcoptes scabiei]|uniref:Large ribosomal subunit protein uL4m n=1 Tax=Sarcoptes scabiei TaxID=52283 RepID=A0A132AJR6_SARSC|nr:39S ribosomal protein L4 [Sarcoptes scabiei]KPM11224.1 39S ribosomal protein L4, mitochondrial-like protein [Sarcoptes scabiei]UXI14570.1 transcription initiation factor TFII-D component [Sarcoptes scabiei]